MNTSIQDEYVFLTSNVKSDIGMQENNTIGNYYTHLPKKLILDDSWEVSIAEITYSKSWFNVPFQQKIDIAFISKNNIDPFRRKIHGNYNLPAGNYATIEVLVDAINSKLDEIKNANGMIEYPPYLSVSTNQTNKVIISFGATIEDTQYEENNRAFFIPIFPEYLCNMLGFTTVLNECLDLETYGDFVTADGHHIRAMNKSAFGHQIAMIGEYQYQMKPIHTLYVYSDIIQPRIVGNSMSHLLRNIAVPSEVAYGEDVYLPYKKRFYHPLSQFEIDKIRVEFKDDSGENILFNFGRTTLALHFRKRPISKV